MNLRLEKAFLAISGYVRVGDCTDDQHDLGFLYGSGSGPTEFWQAIRRNC
jgi:hypothetical protein